MAHLSAPTQPPQPRLYTQSTGDKAFTINAGAYYILKFEAPPGSYSETLKGHFSATGGMGNDVEVYVVTEDDLVNLQNGHQVHSLYDSGRVTQETMDVNLPTGGGKYCLVFSNKFSLLTPKAVQSNLTHTYYTR